MSEEFMKSKYYIFQILTVASPGTYVRNFQKNQKSKRYLSYKSQPKVFKLVLHFRLNGLYKWRVGIFIYFENFKF